MFAPIDSVIKDIAAGKMVILVDDEARENEGDLVIAADHADAAAVNFMAKYGRGLICLTLEQKWVQHLNLPLMAQHNQSRHQTAFTVSIEAREGISTGISAQDRATTIKAAIQPDATAADLVSPGHVFPLAAQPGGVLVRAGHTEASVDLAMLAGCRHAGVICEIMNDDGSMARLPDLIPFAKQHNLKIAQIADLIEYRRRQERLVQRLVSTPLNLPAGDGFVGHVYAASHDYAEHVALVKGRMDDPDHPPLVRMHVLNIWEDIVGANADRQQLPHTALKAIHAHGNGALVLLRPPQATSLSNSLNDIRQQTKQSGALRDYGIGAQILLDLGIKQMHLLTNSSQQVVGLDGYGLEIIGHQPLNMP